MSWSRNVARVFAFVVCAFYSVGAHAVLVGPGSGTQNTTEPLTPAVPVNVPGWYNVGHVSLGSGVYLGNRWVLTAYHLDPIDSPTITFYTRTDLANDGYPSNGTNYGLDTTLGSYHRITNGDGSPTDMILMRTLTDPGLPSLTIPSATPVAGTNVVMAGLGVARGSAQTYDALFNPSPVAVYSGYQYNPNGPQVKRWGTSTTANLTGGSPTEVVNNSGNGSTTTVLDIPFRSPSQGGSSNEAYGVNGDSGGAVFSASSPNTLLGVMLYESTYPNQPAGEALYGDATNPSDLATYYSQITTITAPEPASALLTVGAFGFLAARRRRII